MTEMEREQNRLESSPFGHERFFVWEGGGRNPEHVLPALRPTRAVWSCLTKDGRGMKARGSSALRGVFPAASLL